MNIVGLRARKKRHGDWIVLGFEIQAIGVELADFFG